MRFYSVEKRFYTVEKLQLSTGLFLESRHVECSDPEGNVNDIELCDESKKPEMVRDCETENPEVCENFWVATQWSTCSSKCQNITGMNFFLDKFFFQSPSLFF